MKISKATARRLAVRAQGLDGAWRLPKGKEGVAQAVERLGYVQIDTIAVVQRAHHHTIWSRRPDYAPEMLHDLQANDRRVFEYWTHAASCVPMSDYRYYLARMHGYANSKRTMWFFEHSADVIAHVRRRIRDEGPLGSADFADPRGKRGSWWDWKPAKRALETLFSMGELMVTERRNFQRIYDLTERVLPAHVDTTEPARDESARAQVRRTLSAAGVSALRGWWIRDGAALTQAAAELVEDGEAASVEIDGEPGDPHYALTANLDAAAKRSRRRKRVHLLSPFDNLVIRRRRLNGLFGFDYKLECYTPAAKRRHGYFCLPILWGDRFIGRLDPKADRKTKTLIVRNIIFEPGFDDLDAVLPDLAATLRAFAQFNECERIVIERTKPGRART